MPCYWVRTAEYTARVCTRDRRSKRQPLRCVVCNVPEWITAMTLCDGPIAGGKTCDQPVCVACATHLEPQTDYCPGHAALARASREET